MGTIAHNFIHGLIMPIREYIYHPHEGGSLVFGLAAAPVFALFGPSYFSLKITALLFACAAFALWYLLLLRFFHLRSAVIMGILLCVGPPGLIRLTLWCSAHHTQNPLFDIAIVLLFCRFQQAASGHAASLEAPRYMASYRTTLCLFGAVSGFALFFSYFSVFSIAACLITWIFIGTRQSGKKTMAILLIAFIIGFSPWLFFNLQTGFSGVRSILELMNTKPGCHSDLFNSLGNCLWLIFFDSYWFNHSISTSLSSAYAFIFSLIAISSVTFLFYRTGRAIATIIFRNSERRRRLEIQDFPRTVVAVYLIIFPLTMAICGFESRIGAVKGYFINYRYFSVCLPFVLCAITLLLSEMAVSPRHFSRIASFVMLGIICVFSIHPIFSELISTRRHEGLRLNGYSYYMLGWRVSQKEQYWGAHINDGLTLSDQIASECDRMDFLDGFTEVHWWEAIEEEEPYEKPEELRAEVVDRTSKNIKEIIDIASHVDESRRSYLFTALGRVLCLRYEIEKPLMWHRAADIVFMVPREYLSSVFYGIGQSAGSAQAIWHTGFSLPKMPVPKNCRSEFFRGFGNGIRSPYIQIAQRVPTDHCARK